MWLVHARITTQKTLPSAATFHDVLMQLMSRSTHCHNYMGPHYWSPPYCAPHHIHQIEHIIIRIINLLTQIPLDHGLNSRDHAFHVENFYTLRKTVYCLSYCQTPQGNLQNLQTLCTSAPVSANVQQHHQTCCDQLWKELITLIFKHLSESYGGENHLHGYLFSWSFVLH